MLVPVDAIVAWDNTGLACAVWLVLVLVLVLVFEGVQVLLVDRDSSSNQPNRDRLNGPRAAA